MKLLDLFSGIGGFSLGLERAGFQTVAFCEIEPFCRDVLRKHWPHVPIYDDVRELTGERLRADGIEVDAICGGFPCQDISLAGKGAGLSGQRSGLWSEYARLIHELRPKVVIVENVAALRNRGLDRVLGEMAALGYDAEWHCIPASSVGAPHRRDRIWIVAYPVSDQLWHEPRRGCGPNGTGAGEPADDGREELVADANSGDGLGRGGAVQVGRFPLAREIADYGDAARTQWRTEPDVGRVAHGVPARVHRLRALGNAVVPQIPEIIGKAIMASGL